MQLWKHEFLALEQYKCDMQAKKQDKKVLLHNEIEQSSFKAIANQ